MDMQLKIKGDTSEPITFEFSLEPSTTDGVRVIVGAGGYEAILMDFTVMRGRLVARRIAQTDDEFWSDAFGDGKTRIGIVDDV